MMMHERNLWLVFGGFVWRVLVAALRGVGSGNLRSLSKPAGGSSSIGVRPEAGARIFFLAIIATIVIPLAASAQITGGHASGQAVPQAATKASLDVGPVGDNVNLFTGTLSLSHPFGNVATLSGLAFPIELQYEGSMLQGLDPEPNAGIPYGEGWTLANASVTVDGLAWDYTQADTFDLDPQLGRAWSLSQVQRRGRAYFANPTLHLPGGGGGRLVYKYPDPMSPDVAVYHLESFDSYVEVRFDGLQWVARMDDGTEWVFGLAQYRERNPINATAQLVHNKIQPLIPQAEAYRWHLTEIRNNNHANGQRIVLDYLQLGAIDMHPELGQLYVRQTLQNDLLHMNYLVVTQHYLDSIGALGHHPPTHCGIASVSGDTLFYYGSPLSRAVAYRDVLLQSVTALDAQGLQQSRCRLVYRTWRAETELAGNVSAYNRGNFLVLSDPQVVRRDSLYSQRTVWFRGTDESESRTLHGLPRPAIPNPQPFEGTWRRIMHPRAHQNPLSAHPVAIDDHDPYTFTAVGMGVPDGRYVSRLWALGSQTATRASIPFTHSVLESPRLNRADLPPGDVYELRSLVRVPVEPGMPVLNMNADMAIDFRVVSGVDNFRAQNLAPLQHCPHIQRPGGMDWQPTPDNIQAPGLGYWETGHIIKSTTGDIVKWNPAQAAQGTVVATSTPFTLPNLPNEFAGFQVQVGPGSANLAHGTTSSAGNGYPAYYTGRDVFNHPRDSFELRFGQGFGTGAPISALWRMKRFGVPCDTLNWAKGPNDKRINFWFLDNGHAYNSTQLRDNGANQPTAFTVERIRDTLAGNSFQFNDPTMAAAHGTPLDAELWNIELVRIARNPWMLDSVVMEGPDFFGRGDGRGVAVAAWKLSYTLAQAPLPNNVNPASPGVQAVIDIASKYRKIGADTLFRNVFQLTAIRRLDVDSVGRVSASVNAAGGITRFGYLRDLLATASVWEGQLLTELRDGLGGKTTYAYDLGQTRRDHVGENPVGLRQDMSSEVIGDGTVLEVRTPLLSKTVEGPSGPLVTSYQFIGPVKMYKGYTIDAHFGQGWNTYQPSGRIWGYRKAVVQKPTLGGNQRARTEYIYRTDSSSWADKLLFGRLTAVNDYDDAGRATGRRRMEYAADTAYLNGAAYRTPGLDQPNGHQVWTPPNVMLSYEHTYIWGSPQQGGRMHSWFTRLIRETSVDIDPVTGDSVVQVANHTHYDWHPRRDDPQGDYAEMQRPFLQRPWTTQGDWVRAQGGVTFNYPAEPSWQLASTRNTSSAMPGAWTLAQNYYLWDIEPFLLDGNTLAERHEGSMRPFWLARRYGIRAAVYEQRVTSHDGNPQGKPVALSTWYEWDIFRDVEGDFVVHVDNANQGNVCDPGSGGPMDSQRHAVVVCTDAGKPVPGMAVMTAEAADAASLVQLADSSWWAFTPNRWGAVTFADYAAMPARSTAVPQAIQGCGGGHVTGPDGNVKWFGTLALDGANAVGASAILPADRNYGEQAPIDSITDASLDKGATLVFLPHTHDSTGFLVCDKVHGFSCDSSMNAAVAASTAGEAAGPPAVTATWRDKGCPDEGAAQRKNFTDWLDWQFSLRAIHQQVDTVRNNWLSDSVHNPYWPSPHNVWDTVRTHLNWQGTPYRFVFSPGFPTVCTYRVHARNMCGQVVDESDARHLHTVYEYAKGRYDYWFDSCGGAHSSVSRPLYGLPLSVTATDFEAIEQVTRFAYLPNQALRRIISPNGEVADMEYDGRHRLAASRLNGILRGSNRYGGWDGTANATWNQRIGQNFVQGTTVLDQGMSVIAREFKDPLGRGVQAFLAVKDPGAGYHKRFGPKSVVDAWGRVTQSGKPYHKLHQPTLDYDQVVPASAGAASASYEASTASRVLRAARPGNALGGIRAAVNDYRIIRWQQFVAETGATTAELRAIWPGLLPNGNTTFPPSALRIYKTRSVDEDGREAVGFADAAGREVASLRFDNSGPADAAARVVTFFVRDGQGRVVRVIHPDKTETRTWYNLLGWPYKVASPDGGVARMLYNQAGDLRIAQDANLKARGKFLCAHVDRLGRVYRETEAALVPNGYVPLAYRDTMGVPFRSVHTIMDELQHGWQNDTDPNAGPRPWAWDYSGPSFPKLDWNETGVKPVSETRFDYPLDTAASGATIVAVPAGIIHPRVSAALASFGRRTTGRPVVQIVYGEAGERLEMGFMDYDGEGRLTTLLKQFNASGITQGALGEAHAVRYPHFRLDGAVKQQDVDLGCDGRADFSQLYGYDQWGRLETVSVRHQRGTDLVAKYLYDDALGLLRGVVHFAAADSAGNCAVRSLPADTVLYNYDVQDRMRRFGSRFLDYALAYDAANINYMTGGNPVGAAVVRTSQNWAGGINGWSARYKVASEGVTGFAGTTVYGFQYDGMNRLVAADAAVMEQPFVGANGWNNGGNYGQQMNTTRAAWYGDEQYRYDKVGNLTGLRRYRYFAPGQPLPASKGDNWTYTYSTGTHRLASLHMAGQPQVNFTYDGNGNVLSDSRRGVTVTQMGRNDLPVGLSAGGSVSVRYAYGAGGRVFKRVASPAGVSEKYYLRDATGAPVAVHSSADTAWTFQIYGLDLVGEMDLLASGDSVARRDSSTLRVVNGESPSLPRVSPIVPRLFKTAVLGVAIGLQQSLSHPRGGEPRPRIVEALSQVVVPVAAFVVDAVVDLLSPRPAPVFEPPAPSPERTSKPDTSVYPAVKFFVKDHLGNVRVAYRAEIDDTTCLVEHEVLAVMDYSPYGGLLRAWFASTPERWQSTGHERDGESGWDMRGARMYDADYGRFLSTDPLGGAFPEFSPYNYVLGNPISFSDPSGMSPDGGGKDGRYPVAEDGDPITTLPDVEITAHCDYCYLNDVINNYGNGSYIGGEPTLSGVVPTGPRVYGEDEFVVGLDALGTSDIPVVSTLADVSSAGFSFKNGDIVGGIIGAVAATPVIGMAFNGIKWIRKGAKYADDVASVAENGISGSRKMVANGVEAASDAGKSMPPIRNKHLAGGVHPKTGVPFDADGFPDFSSHLYRGGANDVIIQPTGKRMSDFAAANKAAGYKSTPEGFTWHHHQSTGRMQLVDEDIHKLTGHTGGYSIW